MKKRTTSSGTDTHGQQQRRKIADLATNNTHIVQGLVDDYASLLRPTLPNTTTTRLLDSIQWTQLHTVSDERFSTLAALFCKKFKGISRIIWPVVGRNHYAVLDIYENAVIDVYDSVQTMAPGWITDRLVTLLVSLHGVSLNPEDPRNTAFRDALTIRYAACHQQVNADDCGVFIMANMRCLVEGADVLSTSSDTALLRRQFASELLKSTL